MIWRIVFIGYLIFCLSFNEVVAAEWDHDENIDKAVTLCRKNFDSTGRDNFRKIVSKCYAEFRKKKSIQKLEFCAAFDLCAYYLNVNMEKVGFKSNEYFVLDSVGKRINDGFISLGFSEKQRNSAFHFILETTGKWFQSHFNNDRGESEYDYLFKGSDLFSDVQKQHGISGASSKSREIMEMFDNDKKSSKSEKIKQLFFLAGFDLSALLFGSAMHQHRGFPIYEYFSDAAVNNRLKPRFFSLGFTEAKYNKFLDMAVPDVQKHTLENLQKRAAEAERNKQEK